MGIFMEQALLEIGGSVFGSIFNQGASFKSLTDCASRQVTFFVMLSCHLCKTARNLPMKSHIPRFEQARIPVAGDVMLRTQKRRPEGRRLHCIKPLTNQARRRYRVKPRPARPKP